ncbi:prominin-1-like isoform X3 [Watersipora subatra]|uniref:prominin-1-like isoform X3 n=1 Tax=Watersipora subatra TaxID=2589382 RepID=UPI00355BD588
MPIMSRITLVVTLCVCILSVAAQSSSNETNSLNLALEPLYSMTNGFLRVVFPKGINVDTIEYLIDTLLVDTDTPINYSELVQEFLKGYAGFATSVVIGLILVVLMPLIGLCCCCCRMCGKCGGKTQDTDPKNAKCKRILSASFLLIFTLLLIGGMVMVFFSSARLYKIIDDGIINRELQLKVDTLNSVVEDTVEKDVVEKADDILGGLVPLVDRYLDDASVALTSTILSNLTEIEQPISSLSHALDNLNSTLDELIASMKVFEQIRNETGHNYTKAETLASVTGLSSITTQLTQFADTINSLSIDRNIIFLETGVKAGLRKIPNLKKAYVEVNKTVARLIEENFNKSKAGIDTSVEDAMQQASGQVDSITSQVSIVMDQIMNTTEQVSTYLDRAAEYVQYMWYACLTLGSIVALVSLFYMCGLMFGCGERPGPDANFCNKGCGAKFILAAVGFSFIFYAFLMILTTVLFFVGSLTSSQVCWSIQDPSALLVDLEKTKVLIPGGNVTIASYVGAYDQCLNGKSVGTVIEDLDLGFGKQQLLDLIEEQLEAANIDQAIDSINISSSINFLPKDLNNSLALLETFSDFNSSAIPNLTEKVDTIKTSLSVTIFLINNELKNTTQSNQRDALREMLDIFTSSRDDGLDQMTASANRVTADIDIIAAAQDQLQNASESAITAILVAQDSINANGSEIIKKILREHVHGLTEELTVDVTNGLDDIFSVRCDKLAKSLQGVADIVCVTTLNPMNGLWFSLGWSLIVMIPCIIVALIVTSLFRREQSYEGDYKEDFSQYVNHQSAPPRSRVKVYPSLPPRNNRLDGERIPLERQPLTSYRG